MRIRRSPESPRGEVTCFEEAFTRKARIFLAASVLPDPLSPEMMMDCEMSSRRSEAKARCAMLKICGGAGESLRYNAICSSEYRPSMFLNGLMLMTMGPTEVYISLRP